MTRNEINELAQIWAEQVGTPPRRHWLRTLTTKYGRSIVETAIRKTATKYKRTEGMTEYESFCYLAGTAKNNFTQADIYSRIAAVSRGQ